MHGGTWGNHGVAREGRWCVVVDDALAGAHKLALEHGIFERPLGVAGIWGGIIRQWLDDLLPDNAVELCSGRVRLVVTEVSCDSPF